MGLLGCTTVVGRNCNDCPDGELQKSIHIAFIKKGTTIPKTGIVAAILAAETACNAIVIRNISGLYDGGSFTEGKGAGKQTSRLLGGVHIKTFTDFNYVGQEEFWNTFKRASQNYWMIYFTDTRAWYVERPITVIPKPAFGEDNQLLMEAEIQVKWSSPDNPISYTADVDALEICPQLFTDITTWVNASGSGATVIGSDITASDDDTVNVRINTSVALDFAEVSEGDLPAGLTVDVSGTYITVTGTVTETGTFPVTLRAANACGVSGEVTATFIIS